MKCIYAFLLTLFTSIAIAEDELQPLEIEKVTEDIYLHKSYKQFTGWGLLSSNGLVAIRNNEAFIIDTPWSTKDTKQLVSWIKEKGVNVIGSVSTHSHEDRTAGIQWLNQQGIPTYASKLTNSLLESEDKIKATHSLEGDTNLLANGLAEAFYPGPGHTVDNLVIWIPSMKLLYGGCLLRSIEAKGMGYTGEADIQQWPHSVEKVLTKYGDAKWVIPGHGPYGGVDVLKHTISLAKASASKG